MNQEFKIGLFNGLQQLKNSGKEFIPLFNHGSLEVELYKPDKKDQQQPHKKDEVYIIASGTARFINDQEIVEVVQGDFLFVAAGKEHRFFEFSEDFSTWVIFYGPAGGEKASINE
ncbi:cupin domain-containing protein [Niabella beijingensis]|uniref:cupin domain-containing protein n=1 Tax=Niabella beijingensis TaxID=2872700 RepID=UPI001CBC74F0|nr:cupin domain-containing protein [Niabella beijingensis]MBZ4188280.1 cupin domain-containing protein [Niabella beijingensis]